MIFLKAMLLGQGRGNFLFFMLMKIKTSISEHIVVMMRFKFATIQVMHFIFVHIVFDGCLC